MRKGVVQLYMKNNEVTFSLAWNIIFSDNFKVVLKFLEIKLGLKTRNSNTRRTIKIFSNF